MQEREEARAAKDFERADEIRDELAEMGWEVRDSAEGAAPGAEGARWPTRSSTGSSRSPRRSGGGGGCTGSGGRRRRRRWSWSGSAGRPTTRGSLPRSIRIPTATPRGLLRREDALLVALDQVQDPRNLGAVCRSAEFAGAAGVVVPERRSAAVTAATCKASAGAVEHLEVAHVRNLADWLARGEGGRLLDLGRRRGGRRRRPGTST